MRLTSVVNILKNLEQYGIYYRYKSVLSLDDTFDYRPLPFIMLMTCIVLGMVLSTASIRLYHVGIKCVKYCNPLYLSKFESFLDSDIDMVRHVVIEMLDNIQIKNGAFSFLSTCSPLTLEPFITEKLIKILKVTELTIK